MSFVTTIRVLDKVMPGTFHANVSAIVGMSFLYEIRTKVRAAWVLASNWNAAVTYSDEKLQIRIAELRKIGGGYLANALIDSKWIRGGAKVILIASRLIYCAEKKKALAQACKNWVKYVAKSDYEYLNRSEQSNLSWSQQKYQNFVFRTEKVIHYTAMIFKEAFLFSMGYMDAYESFDLSRDATDTAMKQLFVNGSHVMGKIIENEDNLLEFLEANENRIMFDKMSKLFNTPNADDLQSYTRTLIKGVKFTNDVVETVANAEVAEQARKVASTFWIMSGLRKLTSVPTFMIPKKESSLVQPKLDAWLTV